MSNIDKQALREELSNPAIGTNAHLRKLAMALLDELEAAEKRIAELEAREVELPKPELVGMGEWPMFNQVDVINALAAAGIAVKGDRE